MGTARYGGGGGDMLGLLIVGALILGAVAIVFIILRPHGTKP